MTDSKIMDLREEILHLFQSGSFYTFLMHYLKYGYEETLLYEIGDTGEFMTTDHRIVDEQEAFDIARLAGQIPMSITGPPIHENHLFYKFPLWPSE